MPTDRSLYTESAPSRTERGGHRHRGDRGQAETRGAAARDIGRRRPGNRAARGTRARAARTDRCARRARASTAPSSRCRPAASTSTSSSPRPLCASWRRWTAPSSATVTATRIIKAGVHLMPDSSVQTQETGTRHRTADRVARQTGFPVISVSQSMHIIALYVGETATSSRTPARSCPAPTRRWPPSSATSSASTRCPARCPRWRSRTW